MFGLDAIELIPYSHYHLLPLTTVFVHTKVNIGMHIFAPITIYYL